MAPSVAAADTHPGNSDSLKSKPNVPAKAAPAEDEMLVLNTIRCLAADLCQEVSHDERRPKRRRSEDPHRETHPR
jgi:hypothetical protein